MKYYQFTVTRYNYGRQLEWYELTVVHRVVLV